MSKMFAAAVAALASMAMLSTAEAKPWDPTKSQGWQQNEISPRSKKQRSYARRMVQSEVASYSAPRRSGVGPRPGKWCGWWMRTQKGGGPEFNVAWNWRKYGSPSGPQVGAVVVWRHHVGMIVGRAANGQWIVKSGNDGGKVRTRARSVAGAVFRI
jgi:hypothetical protein